MQLSFSCWNVISPSYNSAANAAPEIGSSQDKNFNSVLKNNPDFEKKWNNRRKYIMQKKIKYALLHHILVMFYFAFLRILLFYTYFTWVTTYFQHCKLLFFTEWGGSGGFKYTLKRINNTLCRMISKRAFNKSICKWFSNKIWVHYSVSFNFC